MSDIWGSIPLTDLLLLCDSGTWGEPSDPKEGVAVLRSTNINKWALDLNGDIAYRNVSVRDLQNKRLQKGDIIVTKSSGSPQLIGEAALFDLNDDRVFLFSNFTQRLRPNEKKVLPKYLHYFLSSPQGREVLNQMHRTTSGLRNLVISRYLQQNVPIPNPENPEKSILIQQRVINRLEQYLDEHKLARRLHEKIVADTNRLMESVLAEMLPNPEKGLPEGWGALPLSQLASEESNQIIPSNHPSDTFNYWGLDAISEGQIAEPPSNYIQGSEVKSTCISFTPKDVLYSKLRPYLNKVIVPTVDGIGSTEWVVYRPNPKLIRREYLAFVMRTKWFVSLASGTSYGARMPRANKSVLREIKIPIPLITDPGQSLSIQEQIVERISQFSSDVDSMQKGNAQQQRLLVQLEQSILAQAFRGEL